MPCWILAPDRIVEHIAISVEVLRVGVARYQRVRAREAGQQRVVVAGMVVEQPGVVLALAGVVQAGLAYIAAGSHLPPGVERLPAYHAGRLAARCHYRHAAEVVGVQVDKRVHSPQAGYWRVTWHRGRRWQQAPLPMSVSPLPVGPLGVSQSRWVSAIVGSLPRRCHVQCSRWNGTRRLRSADFSFLPSLRYALASCASSPCAPTNSQA